MKNSSLNENFASDLLKGLKLGSAQHCTKELKVNQKY